MDKYIEFDGFHLKFYLEGGDKGPALPLRFGGEYDTMGWDIPNAWAVDRENQAWKDSGGHGFGLRRCTLESMLSDMDPDASALADWVRQKMGMKPKLPGWMAAALSCGWTPPANFNPNDYE